MPDLGTDTTTRQTNFIALVDALTAAYDTNLKDLETSSITRADLNKFYQALTTQTLDLTIDNETKSYNLLHALWLARDINPTLTLLYLTCKEAKI
jgi:hypothetical protein